MKNIGKLTEELKKAYVDNMHFIYSMQLKNDPPTDPGIIYLVQCEGYYKIGIAGDINKRLYQMATGNPFDITVVAYKQIKNCRNLEKLLHASLSVFWKKGEWFKLSKDYVDVVTRVINEL